MSDSKKLTAEEFERLREDALELYMNRGDIMRFGDAEGRARADFRSGFHAAWNASFEENSVLEAERDEQNVNSAEMVKSLNAGAELICKQAETISGLQSELTEAKSEITRLTQERDRWKREDAATKLLYSQYRTEAQQAFAEYEANVNRLTQEWEQGQQKLMEAQATIAKSVHALESVYCTVCGRVNHMHEHGCELGKIRAALEKISVGEAALGADKNA